MTQHDVKTRESCVQLSVANRQKSIVPVGEQFVIEITVVLENTPANARSTEFVNTSKRNCGMCEIGTQ